MLKPEICKDCPLYEKGEGYAVGEGPSDAKVLLLGEALGSEEAYQGRPFIGGAGRTLNHLLGQAGVRRSALYITNVVRCRPPGNRTPTEAEVKFCTTAHKLTDFMQQFNLIVPLGNTALRAVTGKEKISLWRGSVFQVNGKKFLPTYHPAALMRQQEFIPTVLIDFQKINQEAWTPDYMAPKQDYRQHTSPQEVLNLLAAGKPFAFDVETNSLEPSHGSVTLLGLSNEEGLVYSIRDYNEPTMRSALLQLFGSTLLKIGHNVMFDISHMQACGFPVPPPWFDTMIAHHLVLSDVQNDLGYVSSLYTRIPYWKHMMRQDLFWYNACDVDATIRCYFQLAKHLLDDDLLGVFETSMAVLPALQGMKVSGVRVDTRLQLRWHIALNKTIHKLEHQLAERVADPTFNWKSHKQLTTLLYDKLRLPRVYSKYNEGVTANEDALKELFNLTANPIVRVLLQLRKAAKLASTYFALPSSTSDRVHSSYLLHGTATGRLSSRDPNLQNVPKGPARAIYIPNNGNIFVSADYNQVELRIAAILAKEETLLDAFAKGEDVHKKTAVLVYHVAPNEVTEEQRFRAKMIVFGLGYGRGARSLAREYKMTIAAAEHFIEEYSHQFPKIWSWRQECLDLAKKQGFLANPFGRRRYFFGPNTAPKVYNYLPQSTAADVLLRSLYRLETTLPAGTRLVLTVHDSVMVECPPSLQSTVESTLRQVMETPVPEMGNAVFPVKILSGKNWSETD